MRVCLSMKCVDEEYGKGWKGWGKKRIGCSTCYQCNEKYEGKGERGKTGRCDQTYSKARNSDNKWVEWLSEPILVLQ